MRHQTPVILGIESSCDDTAAAVIADGQLLSNVVSSQLDHAAFGGVVPELASRAHQRLIVPVVQEALAQAAVDRGELSAVAVTYGPGLAGSLLVGLSFAKSLALGLGIPLVGVNHLEGHLYSVQIEDPKPEFPYLCLTVSGGHSELVVVSEGFEHEVLGRTRDDAAGEAYDKVGKMLGLGYPGGPVVDRLAADGDPAFVRFPRTRLPGLDFSFSGIKTAVLYYLRDLGEEGRERVLAENLNDIAASFQAAMIEMLIEPLKAAIKQTGIPRVAIVGGVSANRGLRAAAKALESELSIRTYIPPLKFCTDNAAMIAITGHHKLLAGHTSGFDLTARPALRISEQLPDAHV